MSLQIGVFDFFSFTIPGAIYLASWYFIAHVMGGRGLSVNINTTSETISFWVIFTVLSYIVGLIMDAISTNTWFKLFHKDSFDADIEDKCQYKHLGINVKFDIKYSYVLYSLVKQNEKSEIKHDIEKFKVLSIMLRNISFALVFIATGFFLNFVFNGHMPLDFVLFLGMVALAIVAANRSIYYNVWFFASIYQAVISKKFDLDELFPFNGND